jgi:hypothetical protein
MWFACIPYLAARCLLGALAASKVTLFHVLQGCVAKMLLEKALVQGGLCSYIASVSASSVHTELVADSLWCCSQLV